jgi:hypothetical protein
MDTRRLTHDEFMQLDLDEMLAAIKTQADELNNEVKKLLELSTKPYTPTEEVK